MAKALPIIATDPEGLLADNAPLMLHTRLAELYRWAPFIADPSKIDELHAMRIAAKRLRYTMEIFAPAFPGRVAAKEFEALYDKVKSVQEQIGQVHDADVRGPLLQAFLDRHGEARPEIRIGLETLIAAQHDARARHYHTFITYWSKMQKQGFKRRFLQTLATDADGPADEETLPTNGKNNAPQSDKKNGLGSPASGRTVVDAMPVSADPPAEEFPGLVGVPFLGLTRRRALAESGILTIADLDAAPLSLIAGLKGVGPANAQRIKDWLAAHAPQSPGMPPPPPDIDTPLVASADPALARDNDTIFDGLGQIDSLIATLRAATGAADTSKKLARQFDKVASVASELAEGPDTLSPKRLQQAVKLLTGIVAALQEAADRKGLSLKKQEALAEDLRDRRKALQKVLGD